MFNCLSEIKNFKANKLRPTQTKVVTSDGKLLVETRDRSGAIVAKEAKEIPLFVPNSTPPVSQILPGLILGSQDVAQDLNALKKNNITHILNLAAGVQNKFTDQYVYKSSDHPDTKIRDIFDECFAFIDDARKSGTVLVHCNAEGSRSATIIIAYLMKTNQLISVTAAMAVASAQRAVKPNDAFLRQLQNYEEELKKLRVTPVQHQEPTPAPVQRQEPTPAPVQRQEPTPAPVRQRPEPTPAPVQRQESTSAPVRQRPEPTPAPVQRQESTQKNTKTASSSVQKQNSMQAAAPPPPPPPPAKAVPRQASITATQKSSSPVQTPPKPSSPVQQQTPPMSSSPVQRAVPKSQQTQPKPSSPVQRPAITQQVVSASGPRVRHIPIQLEAEESEEEESEEEESEEEEEEEPQVQQTSSSKTGHYSQSVTVTIVSKKK